MSVLQKNLSAAYNSLADLWQPLCQCFVDLKQPPVRISATPVSLLSVSRWPPTVSMSISLWLLSSLCHFPKVHCQLSVSRAYTPISCCQLILKPTETFASFLLNLRCPWNSVKTFIRFWLALCQPLLIHWQPLDRFLLTAISPLTILYLVSDWRLSVL